MSDPSSITVTFTSTLILKPGTQLGPGPCLAYGDSPFSTFVANHNAFLASPMVGEFDIVDAYFTAESSMVGETPTTYEAPDPEDA